MRGLLIASLILFPAPEKKEEPPSCIVRWYPDPTMHLWANDAYPVYFTDCYDTEPK